MSEGNESGVNCTRLNVVLLVRARALASVVFPVPGLSSSRTWPPAKGGEQQAQVAGLPRHHVFQIVEDAANGLA